MCGFHLSVKNSIYSEKADLKYHISQAYCEYRFLYWVTYGPDCLTHINYS